MDNKVIEIVTAFFEEAEIPLYEGYERQQWDHFLQTRRKLIKEESSEAMHDLAAHFMSKKDSDLDNALDNMADTIFVCVNGIYGAFRLLGADRAEAMDMTKEVLLRVGTANDNKRFEDGSFRFGEKDGIKKKILKPDGWKEKHEPHYHDLIAAARKK